MTITDSDREMDTTEPSEEPIANVEITDSEPLHNLTEEITEIRLERIHNRLSIVGFADGHRDDAPWDAPDMEFWGINRLHIPLPDKPWHRWFELHDLKEFYDNDEDHKRFLKEAHFPVYVRVQDMPTAAAWGIGNAVPYPMVEMVDMFGPYFTNTISWLLALGIAMGYEEIHLYGVDMAQDNLLQAEYSQQRPSCEWLIGIAQGRGIPIHLPPGSDLLKASHLYGFDSDQYQKKLIARLKELSDRKETMRGEMGQAQQKATWFQARISEMDGAMQEVQYNLRNLVTKTPTNE